jgi:predicted RNA-binding Zn-ribbon protein involved in translation (DUF1610 family)
MILNNNYIQYCEKCNKAIVVTEVGEFCKHNFEKIAIIKKEYMQFNPNCNAIFETNPILRKEVLILKCSKCGFIRREE